MIIGLSSCCACRQGSPKIGDLEAAQWKLIEFNDTTVNNSGIVLTFNGAEKMIYGQAPCNNFFASYSLLEGDKDNIHIGPCGATKKYCPDSQLEDAFTMRFESITTLKIDGDKLLLIDKQGTLVGVCIKE